MATRQPSFSSPTRLRDRHPGLVEEDLAELGRADDRLERADLDARRVHREDQPGDALVLRRVGVGAHEQLAPVGDLGERRPDLLAGDDVLVAVAHGLALTATRGRSRRPARRSPGTTPRRPCRMRGQVRGLLLVGGLGHDRRAGVQQADEVHADVGRAGQGRLLEEDQLLGERGAAAAVLRGPVDAGVARLEELPLPAGVVGPRGVGQSSWAGLGGQRRAAPSANQSRSSLRNCSSASE